MAIKELTAEQVMTMTLEEKDRWWLENCWKGDMPQLTLRSAITGFFLGGILSLTNLYIGLKTGWGLGVGITSVILSFAMWKLISKLHIGKEMSILENNAMQSIATMAGYMTGPTMALFPAYMMVTGEVIPLYQMLLWMIPVAILGVLYAFPLKKRFINDEQYEFPEGRACGVVLDSLHNPDKTSGHSKTGLLIKFGIFAAIWNLVRSEKLMSLVHIPFNIPEYVDDLVYKFSAIPTIIGTKLTTLTIRFDTDVALIATGGLMSIRAGTSMLLGGALNFFVLAPIMISKGIIVPGPSGNIGFRDIAMWSLWGGVAMMTTSSLFSFLSKPKALYQILTSVFGRWMSKHKAVDILKDIELPMNVFIIGIPIMSFIVIYVTAKFFGLTWWLGVIGIPLTFIFSIIAAHSTALTGTTPTGAMGKLTQLTYAALAPGNVTTNLITAGIMGSVAINSSQLLMDIKPGYMLGAKPRQQAIGHVIGIFAGALFAVPVFHYIINGNVGIFGTNTVPVPAAIQWKAVADILSKGLSFLDVTARWAVVIGALTGILAELIKIKTKGKFPFSAVACGLAFTLPFANTFSLFFGSFIFWLVGKLVKREDSWVRRVMIPGQEAICAGIIAGGALIGIIVMIIELNF